MLKFYHRQVILSIISFHVSHETMSFYVSHETARRDLEALQEQGLDKRIGWGKQRTFEKCVQFRAILCKTTDKQSKNTQKNP